MLPATGHRLAPPAVIEKIDAAAVRSSRRSMRCASLRSSSGRSIVGFGLRRLAGLKLRRASARLRPLRPTPRRSRPRHRRGGGRRALTLILPPSIDRRRKGSGNCACVREHDFNAGAAAGKASKPGGKGLRGAMIEAIRQPHDLQRIGLAKGTLRGASSRPARSGSKPWVRALPRSSRAARGATGDDILAAELSAMVVASATGTVLPLGQSPMSS